MRVYAVALSAWRKEAPIPTVDVECVVIVTEDDNQTSFRQALYKEAEKRLPINTHDNHKFSITEVRGSTLKAVYEDNEKNKVDVNLDIWGEIDI